MRHYFTYFDRNYISRGLALLGSLEEHASPFTLWVLCLDETTSAVLRALAHPSVRLIELRELERFDPELLGVKGSRSTVEYYFTCGPCLPPYIFSQEPDLDALTYLDADLLFYSSPEPIYLEMGTSSVGIIPHRFPPQLAHLAVHGTYNVGLIVFRNDQRGKTVLDSWRTQCLDWFYDRIEGERFADQGYLNQWPAFPGVHVVKHKGADVAPWNFMQYAIPTSGPVTIDGDPLIFYHFQGVRQLGGGLWDLGLHGYGSMPSPLRQRLYAPYIEKLNSAAAVARQLGATGIGGGRTIRDRARSWRRLVRTILRGQLMFVPSRRP